MQFVTDNAVLILGVLFALSEALSLIPQIKASGVFQLVYGVLKSVKELVLPAPAGK